METIAVIEDDATLVHTVTEMLASEGYRSLHWPNAEGAHELIKREEPRAVILDIRMEHPRAGLTVLERLRTDAATSRIPVLVCTGDRGFLREWTPVLLGRRCGVLAKPFTMDDLLGRVRALIDGPPSPDQRPAASFPGERTAKQVVALVDDDGRGATTLANGVDAKGYEALPWRWGNGLFDLVVEKRPDLLVIDLREREQRVLWRVLRRLQHDPRTRDMPVIILTERESFFPTPGGQYRTLVEPINRGSMCDEIYALIGPPPMLPPVPSRRQRRAG